MAARSTVTRAGAALVAVLVVVGGACGGDDGDGGEGDAAAFCEQFQAYEAERQQLSEENAATPGGLDVEQLKEGFAAAHDDLDGLAEAAPEEIRDDVETAVEGFDEAAAEVAEAETVEDIAAVSTELEDETEVQAAGERVEEWIDANCDPAG